MIEYRAILLGFGNVGRALAALLLQRGESVARTHGVSVRIVLVADRSGAAVDPDGLDLQRLLDVKEQSGGVAAYPGGGRPGLGGVAALDAVAATLLLEASPTVLPHGEPGLSHLRAALERGMHVVNANKGPLVAAYHELAQTARTRGVAFLNAATVGAPVPALEVARTALHGAEISAIEAVPNGTTNYILTLMERGHTVEEGIQAAQEAGIAETDPSLDIDGWDSAAKILILANSVLDADVRLDEVAVEGIGAVTTDELAQYRREGLALKLLATARRGATGLELAVAPTPLPLDHPLARLHNAGMGVLFRTDLLGDLVVALPEGDSPFGTAQAMLRDIVNISGMQQRL